MRILFFHPQTRHTPALEWGLDLIQKQIDDGHDVTVLTCGGELASCEINLQHRFSVCNKCIAKRRDGFSMLSGKFITANFLKLNDSNRDEIAALPTTFDSIDELKRFQFDGKDLGMAVASSLISCARDSDLDVNSHAAVITNLLLSAVAIYRSIQNWLTDSHFDSVYVFNGRVATFRAALRAAESKNVNCYVYENGSSINKIQCYLNSMPHSIATVSRMICDTWKRDAANPDRETLGRQFFDKTAQGKAMIDFTAHHKKDLLPNGFDPTHHNIAIFGSSEDEMSAIGDEWANPIYETQLAGLQKIRADIDTLPPNVRIYLRTHPHLRGIDNSFTRALNALNHPRFITLAGDSPVSSYALLRNADTVVSFGSTIGIESVYFGKPSILAGAAVYRDLGATYNPVDHSELIQLFCKPLSPKSIDGALQFGYFMETFGEPFKYFKAETYHTGTFKGQRIRYHRARDYFWGAFDKLPLLSTALHNRYRTQTVAALTQNQNS